MIASTGEQVSVGLLAIALQAEGMPAVSYAGWQVPIATDSAYTKARIQSIDDQRVRADLAAGKVVIITGFQGVDDAGQHHHARPRRLRHLGGGRGGGDEGRRVPDLHRRRRRLHHRPAHRARGAPPAHHQLRRDARDGEPGLQGAADPLGRVRRQVPRAAARAVELHALGHRHRRRSPLGHADHLRGRRENGTSRRVGHRVQPRRSQDQRAGRARQARHRLPDPRPGGRRQHRRRRDHPERLARRPDRLLVHRAPQRLRAHDRPAEEHRGAARPARPRSAATRRSARSASSASACARTSAWPARCSAR